MDIVIPRSRFALPVCCILVAGWTMGTSCVETSDAESCDVACGRLRTCGLLPSPLGAGGFDDCTTQCGYSDAETRTKISDCLVAITDNALWCATDASAHAPCEQASECLREALGRPRLLGRANLDVALTATTEEKREATTACSDSGVPSNDAPPIPDCKKLDIATVTFFVEQRGVRKVSETKSCTAAVMATTIFRGIEPGPVLAGVTLKLNGPPEDSELCKVFLAGGIVSAGRSHMRRIPIPSDAMQLKSWSGICETGTLCTNGRDDDRDGQLDCADLECVASEQCAIGCVATPCSGDNCVTSSRCAARTPDITDGGTE